MNSRWLQPALVPLTEGELHFSSLFMRASLCTVSFLLVFGSLWQAQSNVRPASHVGSFSLLVLLFVSVVPHSPWFHPKDPNWHSPGRHFLSPILLSSFSYSPPVCEVEPTSDKGSWVTGCRAGEEGELHRGATSAMSRVSKLVKKKWDLERSGEKSDHTPRLIPISQCPSGSPNSIFREMSWENGVPASKRYPIMLSILGLPSNCVRHIMPIFTARRLHSHQLW